MKDHRSQVLLSLLCLLLGAAIILQFRPFGTAPAGTSQAAHISQLYESNADLQQQADQLSTELAQARQSGQAGTVKDSQDISVASGLTQVTGPGVTVSVSGALQAFELQDLVNELRNASAEAVAVNGVRLVARSAIVADKSGQITVDKQPVSPPFRLDAIGEPDTLLHAMERKGGLVALMNARNAALQIAVDKHSIEDQAGWLTLPATAADFNWVYGQPVTAP